MAHGKRTGLNSAANRSPANKMKMDKPMASPPERKTVDSMKEKIVITKNFM